MMEIETKKVVMQGKKCRLIVEFNNVQTDLPIEYLETVPRMVKIPRGIRIVIPVYDDHFYVVKIPGCTAISSAAVTGRQAEPGCQAELFEGKVYLEGDFQRAVRWMKRAEEKEEELKEWTGTEIVTI